MGDRSCRHSRVSKRRPERASRHRVRGLALAIALLLLSGVVAAEAALALVPPSSKSLAAGGIDSLLVKPDGTLWSWGANYYGELGLGDTTPRAVPTQVGGAGDWMMVAAGPNRYVKFAIKVDGTLWRWGDNEPWFLSGSGGPPELSPTRVGSDADWSAVAVGSMFALAVKQDGTLWAWGSNYNGQLGLGDTAPRASFTQIGTDNDWSAISCGRDHSAALKQDGSLWSWGANDSGQLGLGNRVETWVPLQVGGAWEAIGCGSLHTLAIKPDGTLWAWGGNYLGGLGQGDYGEGSERLVPAEVGSSTDWVAVDGGEWHSVGLKDDGTMWGWGDNGYGALGPSVTSTVDGYRATLTPTQMNPATDWAAVSCGDLYTLAQKQDGSFVAWGRQQYGPDRRRLSARSLLA